jgi:hypothetical protein
MRTGNPEGARSMRRVWKQLLAGVLAFGVFGAASAYTLTITPADQTTTVGSQIGIGITASDFGVAGGLGAYNLDLSFEAGVLGFDRVVDGLGMGTVAFGLDYALNGGVLTLTDTSFDDPATLLASQSASFTLFTVYFNAIGEGTSFLSLSGVTLSDALGNAMSEYSLSEGSVTVQGVTAPVPEPGTLPLIALGGLACLWMQRRHRASQSRA